MASNSDYNYVRMKGNFFLASLTLSSTNFCHSKKLLGNQFYLIYMYLVNQIALVLLKPFVKKKKKNSDQFIHSFEATPKRDCPGDMANPVDALKIYFHDYHRLLRFFFSLTMTPSRVKSWLKFQTVNIGFWWCFSSFRIAYRTVVLAFRTWWFLIWVWICVLQHTDLVGFFCCLLQLLAYCLFVRLCNSVKSLCLKYTCDHIKHS